MVSLRQKSCRPCARSKRRCDLGFPTCQRCIARGVKCLYPWAGSNMASDSVPSAEIGVIDGGETAAQLDCGDLYDASFLDSTSTWLTTTKATDSVMDISNPLSFSFNTAIPVPKPMSPAMLALLEDLLATNADAASASCWSIMASTTDASVLSLRPADLDVPWDEGPATTGSHYQPRCEYIGRRFAAQASALAQGGHTSFIHHSQIQSSAVLQEALSASALHAMRNPSNDMVVRNVISKRAALLVDAVDAVVVNSPSTGIDILPPIQALLIYQCIRLFCTNDVTQRSQAERDESRLKAWLQILRRQLHPFRDGDDTGWACWVREESTRRTVLFAEMLIGVYAFLKQGWDRAENRMATLGCTAQAALWEAKSTAEWKRTWVTRPRLEIRMVKLSQDMKMIRPDDAEEMSIILMAINEGLDELEEWLGGDAKALERWGLRP